MYNSECVCEREKESLYVYAGLCVSVCVPARVYVCFDACQPMKTTDCVSALYVLPPVGTKGINEIHYPEIRF